MGGDFPKPRLDFYKFHPFGGWNFCLTLRGAFSFFDTHVSIFLLNIFALRPEAHHLAFGNKRAIVSMISKFLLSGKHKLYDPSNSYYAGGNTYDNEW